MQKLLVFLLTLGTWLAYAHAQFQQQFPQQGFRPATGSEQRLRLQVIRHQPCRSSNRPSFGGTQGFSRRGGVEPNFEKVWNWTEKIRFPNSSLSTLRPDPFKAGCYSISGDILVNQRISDSAQMFMMVHYSVDPREGPEPCIGFDPITGCGGWGSCLYCDACRAIQSGRRTLQAVSLTRNGQPINCYEDLTRGIHQNIQLEFCMPTKAEFLRNQGWTEQTWDSLVGHRSRGHSIGVFLTITVFDEPQNELVARQRFAEKRYRESFNRRIPGQEKIPMSIQRNWPFYEKVVKHNSGFVGCHRIYGNLIVQQ